MTVVLGQLVFEHQLARHATCINVTLLFVEVEDGPVFIHLVHWVISHHEHCLRKLFLVHLANASSRIRQVLHFAVALASEALRLVTLLSVRVLHDALSDLTAVAQEDTLLVTTSNSPTLVALTRHLLMPHGLVWR